MADGAHAKSWKEEGEDLLRGLAGGVIVAFSLIYTMEMWFIGMHLSEWHIVAGIAAVLLVNTGLNYASGFNKRGGLLEDFSSSTISIGLAAVLSFVVLVLVNVVQFTLPLITIVKMVALEAIPVSIGISIANSQFSGESRAEAKESESTPAKADLIDIGITIAGAAVFVFTVAPTREVILLASQTTGWHWVGLILFSLLLSYGLVFAADVQGRSKRHSHKGLIQKPVAETIVSYVLAVIVGFLLLYLLERNIIFSSISYAAANAAVIGLPASLGGAIGRILV